MWKCHIKLFETSINELQTNKAIIFVETKFPVSSNKSNHIKIVTFIYLICLIFGKLSSQNIVNTRTYTINDGLPSNRIYQTIEDQHGFLWIATDNGVSRFDGKVFRNFNTKDGIIDNDVISLGKDEDGIIWANSFNRGITYYDEIQNKFKLPRGISKQISQEFKEVTGKFVYTENGEIIFYCSNNTFYLFKNQKFTRKQKLINLNESVYSQTNKVKNKFLCNCYLDIITKELKCIFSKSSLCIDSVILIKDITNENILKYGRNIQEYDSNSHYFAFKNILFKLSNYSIDSKKVLNYKTKFHEDIQNIMLLDNQLIVVLVNGKILVLDKNSLQTINEFDIKISNTVFKDKSNNYWISTNGQGLKKYNKIQITTFKNQTKANNRYSCILPLNSNNILIGNFSSEISILNGMKIIGDQRVSSFEAPIRAIVPYKNKAFAISDNEIIECNGLKTSKIKSNYSISYKSSCFINNHTILVGGYGINSLLNLNTQNKTFSPINLKGENRIVALEKSFGNFIYGSSNKGLFKYDLLHKVIYKIYDSNPILKNKITKIYQSSDSILWICTVNDGLVLLKNDKLIKQITLKDGLTNSPLSIIEVSKSKMAVGSREGLYVFEIGVNYNLKSLSHYTTNDGLSSNIIYDLKSFDSTIYAATDDGISCIPKSINRNIQPIYIQLSSIKINQKDTFLHKLYRLSSGRKTIQMSFAAVSLDGLCKKLQYAINDTTNWLDMEDRSITIELNNGSYDFYIRGIDENGDINSHILKTSFEIATAFYQTTIFWILCTILISAAIFWYLNILKLNKERSIYKQQTMLESQRKKITADLHDDIGASLSSLQINTSIATIQIDQDIKKTKDILSQIENQSKVIGEKIGDFIWSMNPGKDEFTSIGNRIKNYAVEILGVMDIDYKIDIDQNTNDLIKNFSMRKNIVLIAKEAINNAAKYSQANQIHISLKSYQNNITLIITDNGVGIRKNTNSGNGLENMKLRAKEINAIYTIISNDKEGTLIKVEIPCPYI